MSTNDYGQFGRRKDEHRKDACLQLWKKKRCGAWKIPRGCTCRTKPTPQERPHYIAVIFQVSENQVQKVEEHDVEEQTQRKKVMTNEEIAKYPEECKAAILAELQRWVKLGSFARQWRKDARNLITSRWVLTWARQTDGSVKIKARLCVHRPNVSTFPNSMCTAGRPSGSVLVVNFSHCLSTRHFSRVLG